MCLCVCVWFDGEDCLTSPGMSHTQLQSREIIKGPDLGEIEMRERNRDEER